MEREAGAIEKRIKDDTVVAMKAGDKRCTQALRLLTAALKKERIDAGTNPSEADELAVLKRERKRRLEAIELYRQGGRDELADGEAYEEGIIAGYLPEELGDDEIARLVDEAIGETGAETPKDMGKAMGAAMKKMAGRADGAVVRRIVQEKLGG
jgi:uncharacterized protein YqeY